MTYSKFYTGGFVDLPGKTTPITHAALDHIEQGLIDNDTQKGAVNGTATLDGGAKIPTSQIPDLSSDYAAVSVAGRGIARTVQRSDYASLAAALTAAGAGGTVTYPDDGSTWDEAATTISQTVTIRGRAKLRKAANGAFLTITAPNVAIERGIAIDGNGSTYTGPNIVFSGNGTTSNPQLHCDVTNSQQWAVDVGIGAAQGAIFGAGLFSTRNISVSDAAMTAGSPTLTSATANFTSNDVGKYALVKGALSAAQPTWYLLSKITAYTNSTTVTLADNAVVTVSGALMEAHYPSFRFGAEYAAGVTGDRRMVGTYTAGCLLADIGGVQTLGLTNTNSRGVVFSSASCAKVSMSGSNRFATSGAPITVHGINHSIVGATCAGDIILASDSSNCAAAGNICGTFYDYGSNNAVAQTSTNPLPPHTVDPRTLSAASTLNANQAVYMRVRSRGYISKIGVHVGTASGNICVGVYANNGSPGTSAAPGAQKATSGSVTCPVAGYAEVALTAPVFVDEGDWMAIVADNATATFYRSNTGGFGSSFAKGFSAFQSTAFPLPSSASTSNSAIFSVILTGVV